VFLGVCRQDRTRGSHDNCQQSHDEHSHHESGFGGEASTHGASARFDYQASRGSHNAQDVASGNTQRAYSYRGYGGQAWNTSATLAPGQVSPELWEVLDHRREDEQNLLKFAVEDIARPRRDYRDVFRRGTQLLALIERRARSERKQAIEKENLERIQVHYQINITPPRQPFEKPKWETVLWTKCSAATPIYSIGISYLVKSKWPAEPHRVAYSGHSAPGEFVRAEAKHGEFGKLIDCMFTVKFNTGWQAYSLDGAHQSRTSTVYVPRRVERFNLEGVTCKTQVEQKRFTIDVVNDTKREEDLGKLNATPYRYALPEGYEGKYKHV